MLKQDDCYVKLRRILLVTLFNTVLGLFLEYVEEHRSIDWLESVGGLLHIPWLPFYPIFLVCRAQCMCLYLFRLSFFYCLGLYVILLLGTFLLRQVLLDKQTGLTTIKAFLFDQPNKL